MTNSNSVLPNNQSMDQGPVRPLEAIINKASKHYNIKANASSSQSADAPGTSQEPSMVSSMFQPRAGVDPSEGGYLLRTETPPFLARGYSAHRPFLQSVWDRAATRPTPARGFLAYRSSIKDVWDRAEAASENSGAHTSTAVLNPAILAFASSQEFFLGRLQAESVDEDDCGFPYCGGFCALYAPRAMGGKQTLSQVKNNVQFEDNVPGGDNGSVGEITPDDDEEDSVSLDSGRSHLASQDIERRSPEESALEAGYEAEKSFEDDFLDHDAIDSAYSSM
ncbi:hypothetical protein BCON_0113g00070 [Botryotinia convoluta]|uniref:Uncharacterized protein n=1 Tax=Botryotinia convoluta TaxID=54673 RepID=A0A4Z1IBH8_9HELO|nr:hypothetical protein BCON_0113g00070 [Botryotinia convoluta]